MRANGRPANQLREIILETGVNKYAEGSCLVKFGHTHVLCTATIEEKVPPFLKGTGAGWITAEYGMLPRSTHSRVDREAAKGKQSGRTQEIQRLIGRSLRSVVNLNALGERQIRLDCDVIQADGGTRTAAITGSYVALHLALQHLIDLKILRTIPITAAVAAVSCGLVEGQALLDLEYTEDSVAEADANFVLTDAGQIIEIQGTAEKNPFSEDKFLELLSLAKAGVSALIDLQQQAIRDHGSQIQQLAARTC